MNFLKNFAEKAKSVADSPARRPESNGSPGSQEGFICPLCIASFSTPEALQGHYEQTHTGDGDLASSPSSEKR